MIIKAAPPSSAKCVYCFRDTEHLCAQCAVRVCPRHSWTAVKKNTFIINGVVGIYDEYTGQTIMTMPPRNTTRELCRPCRDAHVAGGVEA